MNPLAVFWEASYGDEILREAEGHRYGEIDRDRLKSFRIVSNGEILLEVFPPPGVHPSALLYRRRVSTSTGGKSRTIFLVGWAPLGPFAAFDAVTETVEMSDQLDGRTADFQPVTPHPHEGEPWTMESVAHSVDAQAVRLPRY